MKDDRMTSGEDRRKIMVIVLTAIALLIMLMILVS
jgi:hypothetical protein